ncbi:porin [Paraburkholderia tropica]|uniref:porin n=1 Tax=Paraburkholderia tropica TaxID=92647 RepID=UPI002ABE5B12|nr:porin [Paraburkholderia tropica]
MSMKKGWVAPAAALVMISSNVSAQSASAPGSVTMYGILDTFAGAYRPSGSKTAYEIGSGGMTTSFWGISGSEDLGGGWHAIFALSSFLRMNNGAVGRSNSDPFFARDAYVGTDSPYGRLTFGRQENQSFRITSLFDPFGGSTMFSPLMDQLWTPDFSRLILGDTRWSNAVGYVSPKMYGITVRGIFGFNQQTGTSGGNNVGTSVDYTVGSFEAAGLFQRTNSGPGLTTQGPSQSVYFGGASYDFGVARLMGSYAHTDTSVSQLVTNTYSVGLAIPIGVYSRINASFATTKEHALTPASDVRHTTAGIGYDYYLSKRTDVYASLLYDKLSSKATGGVIGAGIRHSF